MWSGTATSPSWRRPYYAFAERGNLVTASRSGPFFVRDVRHALKVRIMAPVEVRVRRVMMQEQLDQKAATAKVRAYDREMSARLDYLFGVDWTQSEHYDLVINTSGDAWEFYTDLLVAAARHPRYQATPASQKKVRDLSLAAQVRGALATNPRTQHLNVEVTAQAGRVALRAVVFGPALLEAAVDVAKGVPGVTSVSCETESPQVYPGAMM